VRPISRPPGRPAADAPEAGPAHDLLDHAQQIAAIAVGHDDQGCAGGLGQRERAAGHRLGAGEQDGQGAVVEAAQDQDLAAGQ
jgi:hypothetical protein